MKSTPRCEARQLCFLNRDTCSTQIGSPPPSPLSSLRTACVRSFPRQWRHYVRIHTPSSLSCLATHRIFLPFLCLLFFPEAKEEGKERGEGERDACLHDSPPQENERSASSSFPPFSPSPHNPARFWQEEAEEEGKKSVLKSPRRGGGGPHVGSFKAHAAGRGGESAGFSYMGKGRRGFEVYGPPPSSPFPPGRKEKKSFVSVLPHLCPV